MLQTLPSVMLRVLKTRRLDQRSNCVSDAGGPCESVGRLGVDQLLGLAAVRTWEQGGQASDRRIRSIVVHLIE
eukprot:5605318-Karenia_brevis.AAC.2